MRLAGGNRPASTEGNGLARETEKTIREDGARPDEIKRMIFIWPLIAVVIGSFLLLAWRFVKIRVFLVAVIIPVGVLLSLILVDIIRNARSNQMSGQTPATRFDEKRYKIFSGALDSLCIAVGIKPMRLAVMKLRSPNSCLIEAGHTSMIAVTPDLLEQDLTGQRVEAIIAVAVAKLILDPLHVKSHSLKEGDLVPEHTQTPLLEVRADTLAARITASGSGKANR